MHANTHVHTHAFLLTFRPDFRPMMVVVIKPGNRDTTSGTTFYSKDTFTEIYQPVRRTNSS
jgi:hypothetical protein